MAVNPIGDATDFIVEPQVRQVSPRTPDLSFLSDQALRDRVQAALDSVPLDLASGEPIRVAMRRVLLGPRGMPWDAGNEFLRSTSQRASEGTEASYASTLRMWLQYCSETSVNPVRVNFRSIIRYRDDVRFAQDGISGSTWNQNLAAFIWFAETAGGRGWCDPVPKRDWKALRVNELSLRTPRVVEQDQYLRFRTIGLQGQNLDGSFGSAAMSMQTAVRDTLFADFLLGHGTRRAEAAHLTLLDLPQRIPNRRTNVGYLPPNICKRLTGRNLEEDRSWVDRLRNYHDTEWLTTIEKAQSALRRLDRQDDLLVVAEVRNRFDVDTYLHLRGGKVRALVSLSKADRRRLVATPAVMRELAHEEGASMALRFVKDGWLIPLAVFPGTRNPMLTPGAWGQTFREANDRVDSTLRESDRPPTARVTPHMLRHTFAARWLAKELERISIADSDSARGLQDLDRAQIRRRFENPLLRLKNLLGHRSLSTTLIYLEPIAQQQSSSMPGKSWLELFLEGE